ncbi:MAG: hypothetical protein ACKOWO_00540 [Sediminibacterium sp.]
MKRIFGLLLLTCLYTGANAQDTLAGNYDKLTITTGKHIIKDVVTVTGKLIVESGAMVEMIDPGVLVCESGIEMNGRNFDIVFSGKNKKEGVGIIIKNIDNNPINISNVIFTGLELPIFFDFGWRRSSVNISDNQFNNNTGKISVIQVLNPPFNFNQSEEFINFRISHNQFTGNKAALYFEDLKSDQIKYEITNNSFVNNEVYGFKNYNISTNIIYGRVDQLFSKYSAKLTGNSFVSNYLIDNLSDTVVHHANFGVYGTDKTFDLSNNFWGASTKDAVAKSIYDQTLNYNSPKIIFEPFLSSPDPKSPAHVFSVLNGENDQEIPDSIVVREGFKSFKLLSNNKLDFNNMKLAYMYFKDDSTLKKTDTTLTFSVQAVNDLSNKITITKSANAAKKIGYYNLSGIVDVNGKNTPEIKIGYVNYLNDLRRRRLLSDLIKEKKTEDSLKTPPRAMDSLKNIFQKIEAPLKSKIEVGLLSGGAIFTGTISNKNLFSNDINLYNALQVNYTIFSNLSASLTVASFKLSNSDYLSNDNDQIARGMKFSTSMLSISPSVQYDFVDNRLYSKARRIRPSIGFGLDVATFNPTGIYKGKEYNLQPLGTGGQFIDSAGKPYSLMALGYFFHFKVKYQLSRFNSVGIHFAVHKSMSDYLDDVGPDPYPNALTLLEKTKTDAAAAVYFSNPTSRTVTKGQLRNSPNKPSDGWVNFGIFFSRRLFK